MERSPLNNGLENNVAFLFLKAAMSLRLQIPPCDHVLLDYNDSKRVNLRRGV